MRKRSKRNFRAEKVCWTLQPKKTDQIKTPFNRMGGWDRNLREGQGFEHLMVVIIFWTAFNSGQFAAVRRTGGISVGGHLAIGGGKKSNR